MKPGQGFAERVGVDNIQEYVELLRTQSHSATEPERRQQRAESAERVSHHFQGNRLAFATPFTRYRRSTEVDRETRARQTRRERFFTEASYHYPQGTHLGHILSILKTFGEGNRQGTHFDDQYIRLCGNLGTGRISRYRRQVKYKMQAAIELRIITDCRTFHDYGDYSPELAPAGETLYQLLKPLLQRLDLSFPVDPHGIPQSVMHERPERYTQAIREYVETKPSATEVVRDVFLTMAAVQQMRRFLRAKGEKRIRKSEIYDEFFDAPFVREFCTTQGIEPATQEASKRRCPFVLNVLHACGVVNLERDAVVLQ